MAIKCYCKKVVVLVEIGFDLTCKFCITAYGSESCPIVVRTDSTSVFTLSSNPHRTVVRDVGLWVCFANVPRAAEYLPTEQMSCSDGSDSVSWHSARGRAG